MGEFLTILILNTLTLGGPLVLAALGGWYSERAGVMNIALEGNLLTAACVTALVAAASGNAWIGIAGGVGASVLMSLLHWLLTQKYALDHIISGMAINAIALGGTNFLDKRFADLDARGQIPHLASWAFQAFAVAVPLAVAFQAKRLRSGLRLRAVGSDPDKARQMGLQPVRIRLAAMTMTGVLCGIGGAMLVSDTGRFSDGMTSGRGFIALSALIIGGWRPIPSAIAAMAFGVFFSLRVQLEGTAVFGSKVPSQVWGMLPFVITIIAIAGLLGRNQAPAGMGKA